MTDRFLIRTIRPGEASQAAAIELACFPPNEACKPEIMEARGRILPETFIVCEDTETGKLAGFINGLATDEPHLRDEFFTEPTLHDPNGKNVMLLSVAVLPTFRRNGIAREMVQFCAREEKKRGRAKIVLTCLEEKIGMYEKFGFSDLGVSDSTWGGESWHEMIIDFGKMD